MIEKFARFCQESYHELKISSWLSRRQMLASTGVVIVLTLIMAAYVALIDRVLLWFAGILFRIG
jgi:preprotein translocase SecE subunit